MFRGPLRTHGHTKGKAHAAVMGKGKKRRDDNDCDDWDDEPFDLQDMSTKTTTGGAPSSTPAAPPHEPWQPVLLQLLGKPAGHRRMIEGQGRVLCPFTYRGLAELYKSSPELYTEFRRKSGFNLPPDPTSPHTQEGTAFCHCGSELNRSTLEQHCGPANGGKTAAIDGCAPNLADIEAWSKFGKDEQLHYVVRMWLQGKEQLEPTPKAQKLEPQLVKTEIVWPPMLYVKFDPRCGVDFSSQSHLKQTFQGCSHGYPVYHGSFKHQAVLAFASVGDDHAKGYAMAMACLEETKSQIAAAANGVANGILCMDLCTRESDYAYWMRTIDGAKQSRKTPWCDGILRQHHITFVKQFEKAQELAAKREAQRVEAVAQAKLLEEERAQRDAERAQEREERARIDAKYKDQQDALQREREERARRESEYRDRVDQHMSAQHLVAEFKRVCELQVYEMEMQRKLHEEKANSLQEALQSERRKYEHLANSMELKRHSEHAAMEQFEQQLRHVKQRAAREAARQAELEKQAMQQSLSVQLEHERDTSQKLMLRLKMEIDSKQQEIVSLQEKVRKDRERESAELEAIRCASERRGRTLTAVNADSDYREEGRL